MADYEVGKLKIEFTAEDKTKPAFNTIKTSFNSLGEISGKAVKEVTKNISDITAGIKDGGSELENVAKQISQSFQAFSLVTNQDIAKGIGGQILSLSETLKKQESDLVEFRKAWEQAVEAQDLAKINSMEFAIALTTRAISEQKNAIAELRGENEQHKKTTEELVIEEYRQVQASVRQRIEYLQAALALGKAGANTEAYRQELAKLTGKINESENATKKGANGFKKFIKSIGRIALYRAIRRALQMITQSITESIQEFAKIDDNVNDTMSQISSSLQVIKLSFGATFLPLLEMIAPILNQLATGLANFANTISQATAKGDTYWAINSEAIQDYREQLEKTTGTLASFDKVNSLNQKDNKSIFFEERKVDKENASVKNIGETIQGVKDLISSVWEIISIGWEEVVKPIMDYGVLPIIKSIILGISETIKTIAKVIKKLDELGLLKPMLIALGMVFVKIYGVKAVTGLGKLITKLGTAKVGILAVFAAIGLLVQVIDNWGNMNSLQRIIAVVGVATTAFFGLAMALGAFHSAWSIGLATAAIIGGIIAVTAAIGSAKNSASEDVSYMAKGGVPSAGSLFWAGEAGAETVTVGSSGRTEVTNVSQMEEALYNALVRYGRTQSGGDGAVNISIDGQKVFEATRRVARRRGLDFKSV